MDESTETKSLSSRLIHEIHARSLWQVALAYLGGAWAVLGQIDLLVSRFGFSEVFFDLALYLLTAGFVGTMALATMSRLSIPWKRALFSALIYVVTVIILVELIGTVLERTGAGRSLIYRLLPLLGLVLLVPGSLVVFIWRSKATRTVS